ncbi:MAG: thymidylate kinase [Firmicutes bacterium]|nr:thymidylate kinase [Bacillota bacterium]
MGKLIVIEGTDCSGKETQTKKLVERLKGENKKVIKFSFPNYDSPTGKIIGGPYLGKPSICNTWFDNPIKLDPKIASLYYAADRRYNFETINKYLNENYIVILDRYTPSNMAHQGCKIESKQERLELYKWIEELEYKLLELPRPDIILFLHMPVDYIEQLRKNRTELDVHELDRNYLESAEQTYLELVDLYDYKKISCVKSDNIKTIDEIHEEVYNYIEKISI